MILNNCTYTHILFYNERLCVQKINILIIEGI